jgi:hypothetical protein
VNRPDPNSATLSGLSKLERALDRSFRSYQQRAGIPIYITEFGSVEDSRTVPIS